jgi:hypothetical protein
LGLWPYILSSSLDICTGWRKIIGSCKHGKSAGNCGFLASFGNGVAYDLQYT